ncbi:MAG: c-type cytochrome [Acidimicrobiales bacterium]|jgi:ubiquinol-cytochrome c reductase cytochrome c subunit
MQPKLRVRYLLPGLLVGGVAVVGLLTSGATASQAATPPTTAPATTAPSSAAPVASPSAAKVALKSATSAASNTITYHLPPSSYIAPGQTLFELNCSSCHGADASGTDRAPNLQGLGPATVDFWVSTGRMPLAVATQQPVQKPARFNRTQTLQIVAFVNSLAPAAPDYPSGIPSVNLSAGNLVEGNSLFVLNCAGCHTITGAGDALSAGYFAPSLHKIYPRQIAEAIRTGPTQMPHFGPRNLTDQQVADIVKYVTTSIQHPANHGGLGLGGIGPVAEGFIGLLFGVGGIMLVAFWLGDRK